MTVTEDGSKSRRRPKAQISIQFVVDGERTPGIELSSGF